MAEARALITRRLPTPGLGIGAGGSQSPSRHALFALFLVVVLALPSLGTQVCKPLADGVTLLQDINTDPKSPLVINVLRIDPKAPRLRLACTLANDGIIESDATKGRETVSAMVARKRALAGVNADYFPYTGDPLGLAVMGGELVSEPMDRVALGITAPGDVLLDKVGFTATVVAPSGAAAKLHGLNRPRGKNELILYTPVYGSSTDTKDGVELSLDLSGPIRANSDVVATATAAPGPIVPSPIPRDQAVLSAHGTAADWLSANVHKGDKLTLRFDIKADSGRSWDNVMEAVGGGPWLLRDGKPRIDNAAENLPLGFDTTRHPRTAAGVTASGELLLVTVDGRQTISQGMALPELAELMKSLGAVDAINLDGGGSTTLSIRGLVINSPCEGKERPVADALLIYGTPVPQAAVAFRFAESGPVAATSGDGRMLGLIDEVTGQPVCDETANAVLWGTTGGIEFVNQKGYFTPIKVGKGSVVALLGDQRIELPVAIVPGSPAKLVAKLASDPSGAPNRSQVDVKLVDLNGNGIPGKLVTVSTTGGVLDSPTAATDGTGAATFGVTWDSTPALGRATVSAAGLTALASR